MCICESSPAACAAVTCKLRLAGLQVTASWHLSDAVAPRLDSVPCTLHVVTWGRCPVPCHVYVHFETRKLQELGSTMPLTLSNATLSISQSPLDVGKKHHRSGVGAAGNVHAGRRQHPIE